MVCLIRFFWLKVGCSSTFSENDGKWGFLQIFARNPSKLKYFYIFTVEKGGETLRKGV